MLSWFSIGWQEEETESWERNGVKGHRNCLGGALLWLQYESHPDKNEDVMKRGAILSSLSLSGHSDDDPQRTGIFQCHAGDLETARMEICPVKRFHTVQTTFQTTFRTHRGRDKDGLAMHASLPSI